MVTFRPATLMKKGARNKHESTNEEQMALSETVPRPLSALSTLVWRLLNDKNAELTRNEQALSTSRFRRSRCLRCRGSQDGCALSPSASPADGDDMSVAPFRSSWRSPVSARAARLLWPVKAPLSHYALTGPQLASSQHPVGQRLQAALKSSNLAIGSLPTPQ